MRQFSIGLILLIFASVSCTDFDETLYDKLPEDEYPENDGQVATLAVKAYEPLTDLIDDNGWWFLAQEISSDEFCGPTRDADWDDGGKWRVMHRHTWTNDVEGVNRMWGTMWSGVTKSNITLDQLRALPEDEAVFQKIAEVEVLRSFYYYLLIDNYGDVPYLTTTIDVPDQPYKLAREDIFDSLTHTVKKNISLLKDISRKYMVTKNTGYALLAKLYLNAEVYTGTPQYELAANYTDSVLAGAYSLEGDVLAPFVTDNSNSSEIIFAIAFDEDLGHGFRLHMRTLHYHGMGSCPISSSGIGSYGEAIRCVGSACLMV
ncbi:MAG: RagB/SusD family nutrient uptake outer membrane protein [Salinivirgaceae bacterium]